MPFVPYNTHSGMSITDTMTQLERLLQTLDTDLATVTQEVKGRDESGELVDLVQSFRHTQTHSQTVMTETKATITQSKATLSDIAHTLGSLKELFVSIPGQEESFESELEEVFRNVEK